MFNNNYYDDQEQPPFQPPFKLQPTLHTVQMEALTGIGDTSFIPQLDTRKITGLGIAMCTDDWLIRAYLARLG